MSIFDKRVEFKPYEYPDALKFVEALQSSIWNHREFNFTQDINDFNVNLNEYEKGVVKRTLLAISQIEISVKLFWSKLFDHFPKPEFNALGVMLAYNELVHEQSYSELLEILGFNDEFSKILQVPEIQGRVEYLQKYIKGSADNARQAYTLNIALFSSFIENCSLFSQFFIMKSMNQHKNYFHGVDNVISATMLEEDCFIEGTEVMTPQGWRLLEDMKIGDDVYGFKEGELRLEKVIKTTSKNFEGNLIKIGNKRHHKIVTPNHDMILHNSKGWYKETAEQAKLTNCVYVPVTAKYSEGNSKKLTDLERIYIAVQADGSKSYWYNHMGEKLERGISGGYNYILGLSKQRKIERFDLLLRSTGIKHTRTESKDGSVNYYLSLGNEYNYKKFNTWINLTDVSREWCEDFINEILLWDGHDYEYEKGYSSTDKSNIDIIQQISVLAGYRSKVRRNKDSQRKATYNDCYKINFTNKDSESTRAHSYKKELVDYSGKVNCITVPSGGIVTRYQDSVFISGNCHAKVGAWLISLIKEEYPEWFDEDFEKKMTRACKKAYEAEIKIVDWIMDNQDMDILNKSTVDHFLRNRFNQSMIMVGLKPIFEVDEKEKEKFKWFDLEVKLDKHTDLFYQRSVNYARDQQSVTSKDLF